MSLCDNPCGVNLILPDGYVLGCEGELQNMEPKDVWFILCDYQMPDLTQGSFDAARTANKLRKLPAGKLTMTPTTGAPKKIGCNRKRPGNTTWAVDFKTWDLEETLDMFDFFDGIYKKNQFLQIFWNNCPGFFFLGPTWSPWQTAGAVQPEPVAPLGYTFSFLEPPHLLQDGDDEDESYWQIKGEFKYPGVLVPCELPGVNP